MLNETVHSGSTDPSEATGAFGYCSQQTLNYTLKGKSKYCTYPKEHSTVEKVRWKTKGGEILFREGSEGKNSRELKRYVSQNIRSNSWNSTVKKSVFWPNLHSARFCCIFI